MIDREKVIDGLDRCNHYNDNNHCDGCSYRKPNGILSWCIDDLMVDALALLKEQSNIIEKYHKADSFLFTHGWRWTDD